MAENHRTDLGGRADPSGVRLTALAAKKGSKYEECTTGVQESLGKTQGTGCFHHGGSAAIYASCVCKYDDQRFMIADNYFGKTRENFFNGTKGSLLFITEDDTSYQVKGRIEYHQRGEYYDNMKKWNPENLPGYAVAILYIEEIYSGSRRLI
ncbi:MAG: hypothetical protein ACP5FZ_03200 [Fidelibacterota bacterium]